MVEGLQYSLTISGDPLDLIVLRKGSSNETGGGFTSDKADDLLNLPGIARDDQGHPLAAKELLNIPLAERTNGTRTNIIIRGVQRSLAQAAPGLQDRRRQGFRRGQRRVHRQPKPGPFAQGGPDRRTSPLWRQGRVSSGRPVHGWRQRRRERSLGRPQGRREEHRPRRLGLQRSAPRRHPGRLCPAQTDDRRRHPVQARGHPRVGLFREPDPVRALS